MKKLIQIIGLVVAFMIFLFDSSYAQFNKSSVKKKYYWVNFGAGAGSIGENAIALSANATYHFGKNLLTLRSAGTGELFGKTIGDDGILYGIVLMQKQVLFSVGVGLASVKGSFSHGLFSSRPPEKIGPTIGIPLEAQLFWRPAHFLGIGLYAFANLNSEEPFAGITLGFQFGKLR
ncbi:MAG: hypothetical protein JSW07_19605 [bacterium]|nr:MAG: hypothetical protein JSW07_19605 [bacterium]